MTDSKKLNALIVTRGLKKNYIAKELGIAACTLSQKIANKRDFKVSEIVALCELLDITDLEEKEDIFFSKKVA